jgi:hypothetical protein
MDGRESFAAYEIRWATRGQSIPPQLGEGDDAKTLNLEPAGDLNELKLEIFDSVKDHTMIAPPQVIPHNFEINSDLQT